MMGDPCLNVGTTWLASYPDLNQSVHMVEEDNGPILRSSHTDGTPILIV